MNGKYLPDYRQKLPGSGGKIKEAEIK